MDPPKELMKALEQNGISKDDFFTLDHGASRHIFPEKNETEGDRCSLVIKPSAL